MTTTRAAAARLIFVAVLTIASLIAATRLELSKDLTTLFPRTKEADALALVTRAFGGGDVALVLVRGKDAARVEQAATRVGEELRSCPSIRSVMIAAPTFAVAEKEGADPTQAWRFAGPMARDRLARAVSEEGMRERLRETRALLLAPGAGGDETAALITRDPLRLSMIPWQERIEIAAGAPSSASANGAFVTADGRARLVVIEPRGRAFEPGEANRFTTEAEAALARVRVDDVTLDLTGGHVVAKQTEAMVKGDLHRSGALSLVLASIVFLLTFRRARALVAVLPPLAAGTLWTMAIAALAYPHLSAVATAFAAVVIGVGVDTGVHVYGRLLEARRDGLSPSEAARVARRETWKPTLGAAIAAGGAFGCLGLSNIEGMRQLGVLCAAGEVLTAIAILIIVPEIGALLERGTPPKLPRASWVAALTSTRSRSIAALACAALCVVVAVVLGVPKVDHAVITLDARTLPALATYDAIYDAFGGARGQLVIVSSDRDASRARTRSDAVAEAADRLLANGSIIGFDALARLAPSPELQSARIAERDRLDLPSRRAWLARALEEEGFAVAEFAPALAAFEHPSTITADVLTNDWLRRRYLAENNGDALAVTYVRMPLSSDRGASRDDAMATLRAADPDAVITGFAELERGLTITLAHDLPRVLGGAFAIIVIVLGIALRRPSRVALAIVVLGVEIAIVLTVSRVLGIRWHVYDALVVPVLLGITLDEAFFLIDAVERRPSSKSAINDAIAEQAPLGTATALTTAAGFGALVICRFDGLVDVGKVGALGSTVGLVVALVLIPAAYRIFGSFEPSRAPRS